VAEDPYQLVANDADDFLHGRKTGANLFAQGLDPDTVKQLLYYIKVNVGIEKRKAYLAQGLVHDLVVQDSWDTESLKNLLQPVLERVKH